jgi:two-component system chemotaxis sensor kinase CheA
MIVESAPHLAAIGVDRLRGTASIVVRPLPLAIHDAPLVSGVFLDEEGTPQLLLDPKSLVESARTGSAPEHASSAAPRRPVLIIDDSLTTRMLEESILASAGYDVEVACSGEEAMEKVRSNQYSLFIVDIEMPGMSGFEFVERTRADPVLSRIPAILVTSLSAAEDKERGKKVGACAYIVKSEFDQEFLVNTIRNVIG